MAIYEIGEEGMRAIEETSYASEGFSERRDLQRLLRNRIEAVAEGVLLIAEEFCDWEDSRRRIDLLGIDKEANLVVIELKCADDGSHMELQAIRYAAMVSTMTFDKAVETLATFHQRDEAEAHTELLEFLSWEEPDEERFAQDVRIVLVSPDFSKEITTAVIWLNERDLDIRCVRVKPYKYETRVLLDVQQVIPLPEAQEYQVRIREKAQKEREDREDKESRQYLRKEFWRQLLERSLGKSRLFTNVSPSDDGWLAAGGGVSDVHYTYRIRKYDASIELVLEGPEDKNKAYFDQLRSHQQEIEQAFGAILDWDRGDGKVKSGISGQIDAGGYRSDRQTWPEAQDTMIQAMGRLETAMKPYIARLKGE